MHYNFPTIKRIEDVLPAIEGRDEFIVAEREQYDVINYNVGFEDTFTIDPDDLMANYGRAIPKGVMRRECRGLIFDKDGLIMSRPFHKFFNIGEREETLPQNIDMSQSHVLYEKMDGSMIRPLLFERSQTAQVRLGTKMGLTDTALEAEKIVTEGQLDFMRIMSLQHQTVLTEFVSPSNRIVVEYTKPELVLLAIRNNITGEYMDIEQIRDNEFFRVVPNYGSVDGSLDQYLERLRKQEGSEGVIFAFGDMRYKGKNDWYVRIHKVKDKIRTYRHVLALVLESEIDDVLPHLDENDYNRIKQYEADFHAAFQAKSELLLEQSLTMIALANDDKKTLATEVLPKSGLPKAAHGFVFKMADVVRDPPAGFHPRQYMNDLLMQYVRKHTGNTAKYEALAEFLNIATDQGDIDAE